MTSTTKIEAIQYNSKSKISLNDDYEFRDITIKRNGDIISAKGGSTWISSSKGFIYLSYCKGRVYFMFDKLDQSHDSTITDIGIDRGTKTFSFRYKGLYEINGVDKEVDFIYEVLFDFKEDFNEFVKTIDCFIKK